MMRLSEPGWEDSVKRALNTLLADKEVSRVAVFDLDDTIIENDIGEAVLLRQILELAYAGDDLEFWQLFVDETARRELHGYWNEHKNDPRKYTLRDYDEWPEDFRDYVVLFYRQYLDLLRESGPRIAYPWAAKLLTGKTESEIAALTRRVLEDEIGRPQDQVVVDAKNGIVRLNGPIRVFAELRELIGHLQNALGWEVWVISASNHYSVGVVAEQIGIDPDRALGIQLVHDDERLTTNLVVPVPYREGKSQLIRRLGLRPSLVVGDSLTDLEMLRVSERISLLVDHGKIPKVETQSSKWLLQPAATLTSEILKIADIPSE